MKVIKRDGRKVKFNKNKIVSAILAAMEDTDKLDTELAERIADKIESKTHELMSIEEISDLIEKELMKSTRKDVAKTYIVYRKMRDIARGRKVGEVFNSIINAESNEITKDNANMNSETPAGMMMKFASETTKRHVDDYIINPKFRDAMDDNFIYIHDKDYYPTKSITCLQHPIDKILKNGFRAGHGASRPAKRIETAGMIACISLETIQNVMHGGQSIPAYDFYLAPYVRMTLIEEIKKCEELLDVNLSHLYNIELTDYLIKDLSGLEGEERYLQQAINKTVNRVRQTMESFIHNMNTIHSRGGNQVVFSSINYGTDTSAEGRCVIRELLLSTYDGVGNSETAIFPIQIWKKKRGVNYLPTDRNYDLYQLVCKVTAKRFFPNINNLDATFNHHEKWNENDPNRYMYEPSTMGCRTRVFENIHGEKTSVGRGNLSFTTLNIVKMAIESMKKFKNEEEKIVNFYKLLNKYCDIAAEQLYERYKFQCTATKKQFPMLMNGMWQDSDDLKDNDTVEKILRHGTLGIGFVGLAECLVALIGEHHAQSDKAQRLGLDIVKFISDKTTDYKQKYKLNYSCLATPAESACGTILRKDKKVYGSIEGVTDKEYYTNSNHVPVWWKCDVVEKAKIEAPYHDLTRGGHIFYVEFDGDATHNIKAIMQVVDIMDKYNIGYGSINHVRNRCLDCGYEDSQKDFTNCPKCQSDNVDIIQRITGYLVGSVKSWNSAKVNELHDRTLHS